MRRTPSIKAIERIADGLLVLGVTRSGSAVMSSTRVSES
jgi:hypothetical protein